MTLRTMRATHTLVRMVGIVAFLGIATLALPLSAHAGGVQVSVGIGVPLPEPVVVAPAPVVVALQPVVVQPAPVIVHPAPVVVAPAPVVVRERWLPPGIAKKYYGYPTYGKRHHHDD